MRTSYRLADNEDIFRIYEMFDLTQRLGWPVVVAERQGRLIGFIGTQDRQDMVVAGPMEVKLPKNRHRSFVARRLVEMYDEMMRQMKIGFYWFSVAHDNDKWLELVKESGLCTIIEEQQDHTWFKRQLVTT